MAQLEHLDGDSPSLPPSLRFERLEAGVQFKGDIVETPGFELISEGITVSGGGQFVTDGDMDYDIRVKIAPEAARKMPALQESLNIEGHRLAQQDIELGFKITGPTLKPRSELAQGQPMRVTLVTGALQLTSTALQVIDTPRKILVDLLKIGGGIVSPRKQPEDGGSQ